MLINSEEMFKTGNIVDGNIVAAFKTHRLPCGRGHAFYAHTALLISVRLRDSILLFQITSQITRSLLPLSSTLGDGGRSFIS